MEANDTRSKHEWSSSGNEPHTMSHLLWRPGRPKTGSRTLSQDTHQNRASSHRRLLYDTWMLELVTICLSILCLVAIGAVLIAYDGHTSPELAHGLTLNAIISILATACKSNLVFSVASCISQLKWYWFQESPRPLRSLQRYDDASRGFYGAFLMLFTPGARSMALLGALITILAVTFDPFVQQLIKYPIRGSPSDVLTASTSQAKTVNSSSLVDDFATAVNYGIWALPHSFDRNPSCPTGNCTWPTFNSVGWCTKCGDITSSASVNPAGNYSPSGLTSSAVPRNQAINPDLQYPLPDVDFGISLDSGQNVSLPYGGSVYLNQNGTLANFLSYPPTDVIWIVNGTNGSATSQFTYTNTSLVLQNMTFLGVENPLIVLAHASIYPRNASDPSLGLAISKVEQCLISLCERTYNVSVSDGQPVTTVEGTTNWGVFEIYDSDTNSTLYGWNGNISQNNLDGDAIFELYWTPNRSDVAAVQLPSLDDSPDLQHWATPVGYNWYADITSRVTGNVTGNAYYEEGAFSPGLEPFQSSSDAVTQIHTIGLEAVMNNMAASLTALALQQSYFTVNGTVIDSKAYVKIEWRWLILPCLLEVAGILFLLTTMILSRRHKVPLWKSSIFALLYHGLEKDSMLGQEYSNAVSGMETAAESTSVQLVASPEDGVLALRRSGGRVVQ